MKIGFALPYLNHVAHQVSQTADFAREAEKAGAASLWVGDRNFAAVNPTIGIGGAGDTTIPVEYRTAADPFVLLGVAAATTERVQLGTNVLIAPIYAPVQLARSLTTIDLISGGRLIPGFGVGWSPEEFTAANLDFSKRGARTNEMLDALELLWTEDPVEYHGRHLDLPLQHSPLKPVQRPRPPFYIGAPTGASAALKRIGERADGWLPASIVPVFVDADVVLAQRAVIDGFATAAGRDPSQIDTIMRVNIVEGTPLTQVADAIKSLAERTGIQHFMVESMSLPHIDASLELVTRMMTLIGRG
ncbi:MULTISPECIES: TIGR03619 family F420-dependent LLM class oxidoreductase [Streptomycetaceae]|uniref:TIGR03619 family F420-dependent LLM class oxidoreductase n=1 Tax=Streptomyces sp. NBC_01217 TaxID=2903779 RepID=UPI002E1228DA|nr:TIGR03619 family F420-dependent LLM class oxidoreductase [Streptomyces sp. NBC_01217]WSQ62562.1 TIGR03619 family F420-dependent LLM class oxidoreductase [Streptomyces sp. NBC_01217]